MNIADHERRCADLERRTGADRFRALAETNRVWREHGARVRASQPDLLETVYGAADLLRGYVAPGAGR